MNFSLAGRKSWLRRLAALAAALQLAMLPGYAQQPIPAIQPMPPVFAGASPQTLQSVQFAMGPRGATPYLTGVNGAQVTIPATPQGPGFSAQSGVQLSLNMLWPGQFGYRPVVVTANLAKPAAADREIKLRFTAGGWYTRGKSVTVEETFVIPQGASSATCRLLAPQFDDWQLCSWETWVDGRQDDRLEIKQINYAGSGISGVSGMGVLGVDLDAEQLSVSETVLQRVFNAANLSIRNFSLDELPDNWLEYTTLDIAMLPADKAAELVDAHPKSAAALLSWVRSGGNLWIIDSGRQWQELPSAEVKLGLTALAQPELSPDAEEDAADDAVLRRGWRYAPTAERATDPVEGALLLSGFETQGTRSPKPAPTSPGPLERDSRRYFVVRGYGLGAIAAFRGGLRDGRGPRANGDQALSAVTQSLLGSRISWPNRHGNQPDSEQLEFNNLLIPDVGVAPVGQFQILITLFVLGIGPLNYWLLWRKNRLPMLLATVPAAALATTALLFGYGLLADGFGVRVRARTLTLLDQRAGEAVSWGRLSYYAGLSPRSGLIIPADQAMYPIMPRWSTSYTMGGRASSPRREVLWAGDQQRLTRGWLQSRTPTQYHAVAARPSKRRLDFRPTAGGLRVTNRLGVGVAHLAVEDHAGKFYWIDELADGQARVLEPTSQENVATQIRRLFTANLPEFPGGEDSRFGSGYYGVVLSQGVMEARLESINSPQVQSWGQGCYIAFTNSAVDLDLGVDGATEEASFHVIEGHWSP